jgi:hypothetical protein
MHAYAIAVATAALIAFPGSAFSQTVEIGPRGVEVGAGHHYYQGRSASRPECRELRKACLNKEELGEQGQGNCRRYRHMCGRY